MDESGSSIHDGLKGGIDYAEGVAVIEVSFVVSLVRKGCILEMLRRLRRQDLDSD